MHKSDSTYSIEHRPLPRTNQDAQFDSDGDLCWILWARGSEVGRFHTSQEAEVAMEGQIQSLECEPRRYFDSTGEEIHG